MKKLILILACILILQPLLFAQKTIEVSCLKNTGGGYSFYAYNNSKINNVIHLYFTEISNLTSSIKLPYDGDVKPGNNYLFSLTPENALLANDFKYLYNTHYGCLKSMIDLNFPYLLPVNIGKNVVAKLMQSADHIEDARFIIDSLSHMKTKAKIICFDTPKTDYYLDSNVRKYVSFELNYGDTIYAARKGKVYSLIVPSKLETEIDSFHARVSNIEIYQNDCSFANYQGIHNVLVEEDQEVEAGQPIALAGILTKTSKATLTFSVSYYDYRNRYKIDSGYIPFSFNYTYINPTFFTKEGGVNFLEDGKAYTAVHLEEIITREMTKRERKRWLKKHL